MPSPPASAAPRDATELRARARMVRRERAQAELVRTALPWNRDGVAVRPPAGILRAVDVRPENRSADLAHDPAVVGQFHRDRVAPEVLQQRPAAELDRAAAVELRVVESADRRDLAP